MDGSKNDENTIDINNENKMDTKDININDNSVKDERNENLVKDEQKKIINIHHSLLKNIKNPTLKRMSFRAGCKRLESEIYNEMRSVLHNQLRQVIRQSLIVMHHSGRNTLTLEDIQYALRNSNKASVYL